MKKLFLFVFAAIAFAACTQNDGEELSSNRVYLPDEISVGFESNDETRVQLYEGKSVWNAGDLVSVFYKTLDNLMWGFQGEDGDRTGQLKMIEGSVGKQKMSEVVVVYPYNQDYILGINNRSVEAKMPAKQEYRYESYDPACNLMIATSEGRDFVLRNACGWLKIELTGDGQQVEKLTLRGNNGETVAGDVTIDWDSSKATFISNGTTDPDDTEVGGSIVFDEASYDKLELNCHRAVLSSEPTAFYFTLPEQRFVDGITVEVKCRGYKSMVLETSDVVAIKRNHIKPMATVEFEAEEGNYDDDDDSSSSLPEDINPSSTVFPHRLLLIDHTGANCGFCPRVFDGLDALRQTEVAQYYNEVYVHGGAYAPSDSDKAYSDAAKVVDQYYHPDGYPNIRFNFYDGEGDIGNVTSFVNNNTSYINALINPDGAQAGIAAVVTGNNSAVYVSIGVKAAVEQEYRVTAWLLENNIYNPNQSGAYKDSHRIHNHALRNIAGSYSRNDISGDSIGVVAVREIKECTFELPIISTKWNVSNMEVLIIVSAADATGRFEVVNTALCPINNSVDYYGNITSSYLDTPQPSIVAQNESSFTVEWNAIANASHYTVEFDGRKYETTETKMEFTNLTNLVASKYQVSVTANAAPGSGYCDSVPGLTMVKLTQTSAEIWYKATAKVDFSYTAFGVNVISDVWHNATGEGFITFDGDVTTIGENAFFGCNSLISITIPDSVTTIGEWAFAECYSLTSVTIPDSVTTIGDCAFQYCDSLTSITIPDSVTTIGKWAFEYCYNLTSVTIGDSVTTIGDYAFCNCGSLTSVTIPDSVTTIRQSAFSNCSSLTSVTIGDSVTTIGERAFAYCTNLVEFNGKFASEDGRCLIVNGTLNSFAPVGLTSYTIPDNVTTIGNDTFYDCDNLTSVTIPDSVTTIGENAFFGCNSLTSITIPDSVTMIGVAAFSECDSLTSVTIPDSVTTIGDYAFYYCRSLTSVTIPDSVTTIGEAVFADCDSLTSVTIPDSVTTIGVLAFAYCDSLTSITIPDSVTTIGDYAFAYCYSLTSVYCEATTPPSLGVSIFSNNASGRKIYVSAASVEAYKVATNWREYAYAIVAYDFENGVVVE